MILRDYPASATTLRGMALPRLRQVVVAAHDLAATCSALESALGVSEPFHDPGVGHFGLANAVYALGDTFVEVVAPTRPGTAAGRHLARHDGDCGYMAMVEVADVDAQRARLADLGVRVVWETAHDDIVDLHLHPKDVPGAIVAVDVCTPSGSWRWGGPEWEGAVPEHGPAGIRGLLVAVADPAAAAARWGAVLGVEPQPDASLVLEGGRQRVRFTATGDDAADGIVTVEVEVEPGVETGPVTVAGVVFGRTSVKG
jgi:hypothetical protein